MTYEGQVKSCLVIILIHGNNRIIIRVVADDIGIHTYKIDHYNPSVRIIDLISHTTMLCVLILDISGRTYSLKSGSRTTDFLEKLFMAILFAILCWEEITEEILFLKFFFWCLAWGSNPDFKSNKPTIEGKLNHLRLCTVGQSISQLKKKMCNKTETKYKK